MSQTTPKRGHNTGKAAAAKDRRRAEAEARNALTPPERTRRYRLQQQKEAQ